MLQLTLDSYLSDLCRSESELKVGDRIYKLILDVIETGVIDHMWEMSTGWGYSAKKDGGCFITFWTPNVGDIVFTDAREAYTKAESLRNTYKVIRAKDMEVIKEINFTRNDCKNIESVKMLKGNMVYFKKWPCYPFLEIFDSEKQAEKRYMECVEIIKDDINKVKKTETEISEPMQDMYLSVNGNWSSYDYVNHNGAVTP